VLLVHVHSFDPWRVNISIRPCFLATREWRGGREGEGGEGREREGETGRERRRGREREGETERERDQSVHFGRHSGERTAAKKRA
jgi:hypothetical protein